MFQDRYHESDLYDYPGMFLGGTGTGKLKGIFAGYPLEEKSTNEQYSAMLAIKRAPFIARTSGKRTFTWRVLIIAPEDKSLPGNDLVYRLGAPPVASASAAADDFSRVKPGNITDERIWILIFLMYPSKQDSILLSTNTILFLQNDLDLSVS